MASKKRKEETSTEEESEEESTTEEETEETEEESTTEEETEESTEEESTTEDETEETESDEKLPAKKETHKAAPEKKAPVQEKAADDKRVSAVGGNAVKAQVKRNNITFQALTTGDSVKPGSGLEVRVNIINEANKQVKSIKVCMREFRGKTKGSGKKAKRPKPKRLPETAQEFFQGARFPLQGMVSYEGSFVYPIPKGLESSTDTLAYEVVLTFGVSATLGWNHVTIALPVTLRE